MTEAFSLSTSINIPILKHNEIISQCGSFYKVSICCVIFVILFTSINRASTAIENGKVYVWPKPISLKWENSPLFSIPLSSNFDIAFPNHQNLINVVFHYKRSIDFLNQWFLIEPRGIAAAPISFFTIEKSQYHCKWFECWPTIWGGRVIQSHHSIKWNNSCSVSPYTMGSYWGLETFS